MDDEGLLLSGHLIALLENVCEREIDLKRKRLEDGGVCWNGWDPGSREALSAFH